VDRGARHGARAARPAGCRQGRYGLVLLAALTLLLATLTACLLEAPAATADNSTGTPCSYTTRIADVNIPDGTVGGPFGTSVTSSMWVPPPNLPIDVITDVNIRVEIQHPFDADLDISVSHAGKTVSLSSDNGGGGANYTGTKFDDQGANGSIVGQSAPFTGSFVPEQALSAFDGLPAEGVWTIRVSDDTGTAIGGPGDPEPPPQKLLSWSVDYRAGNCPFEQPPCDVHGNTFNTSGPSANGSITASARTKGTGTVSDVDVYVHSIAGGGGALTVSFGRSLASQRTLVSGAGPDFVETVFDDQAGQAFPFSPPNTGRFVPAELLNSSLAGSVNADWRFTVARSGGTAGGTFRWGYRVMTSGDGCTDPDNDVIWSTSDNCPSNANLDQANHESDAQGDICDTDDDNDSVADTADACPHGIFDPGGTSPDYDADGCKDPEDADDDSDGVVDTADSCPQESKGVGGDTDGDGCKDFEETDDDNDGVPDAADNCPLNADSKLTDTDHDGAGDACDPDDDGDGVIDTADAFPLDPTRSKGASEGTPVLSKLKLSPKVFAARKKGASVAAKSKRKKPAVGTTITYTTDIASSTTFTVQRIKKGVRKGKRCVKPAKGLKGKSCTRLVLAGSFARRDGAGKARLKFTGRLASRGKKTKALTAGRYVLRVQGRNASGAGKAVTAKFAIVKP
jgi:subtilisin-like proprotein convertase family protein